MQATCLALTNVALNHPGCHELTIVSDVPLASILLRRLSHSVSQASSHEAHGCADTSGIILHVVRNIRLPEHALVQSDSVNSPLAISIIWGIYQIVPYTLVLFYWLVSKGVMLQYMCRLGLLVTFVSGAAAVGLMWGLYPPNYNFAQVSSLHALGVSLVSIIAKCAWPGQRRMPFHIAASQLQSANSLRLLWQQQAIPAPAAAEPCLACEQVFKGSRGQAPCIPGLAELPAGLCRLQRSPTSTTMLRKWALCLPPTTCRGGTALCST